MNNFMLSFSRLDLLSIKPKLFCERVLEDFETTSNKLALIVQKKFNEQILNVGAEFVDFGIYKESEVCRIFYCHEDDESETIHGFDLNIADVTDLEVLRDHKMHIRLLRVAYRAYLPECSFFDKIWFKPQLKAALKEAADQMNEHWKDLSLKIKELEHMDINLDIISYNNRNDLCNVDKAVWDEYESAL